MPDSADFVMYWWHLAAQQARAGRLRRFGFITTNSIRQTFNRRVIEGALLPSPSPLPPFSKGGPGGIPTALPPSPAGGGAGGEGATSAKHDAAAPSSGPAGHLPPEGEGRIHLAYAIPDHPWVDSADGAAVRIAMTVGAPGPGEGLLARVTAEREGKGEGLEVDLDERRGVIHADLSAGANVAAAVALRGNGGVSSPGFKLHGAGFIVTPEQAAALLPSPSGGGAGGEGATFAKHAAVAPSSGPSGHLPPEGEGLIRPYRNGRDLTDKPRGVRVIDAWGLSEPDLRQRYPAIWQWLYERVKPERDHNARASYRDNWWLFGEPRRELRAMLAGLPRYIATVETAKHRAFQFLDAAIAPDNMLVCIAVDDAYALGVLSSRIHVTWALATGGTLEDRPRYNKTRCFETFPFPDPGPEQAQRIRALAEELDAHRKRQQAAHPDLTLTGMYNVLEALRAGRALTAKEKILHEQGLVSLLKQIHDDLDAAVLAAYGWDDLLPSPSGGGAGGRDGGFAEHAQRPSSGPGMQAGARPAREGATVRDEQLLHRLAALNTQRAAEEAQGHIRWLRPAFQTPEARSPDAAQRNPGLLLEEGEGEAAALDSGAVAPASRLRPADRQPWPAALPEQVAAVAAVLRVALTPLTESDIAARFAGKGPWKKRLPQLLDTLVALGRARQAGEGFVSANQ
ncbi:MAG: hypothetical protein HZB71_09835 [Betaproteobacteria bacterium]|nr:hypothetical protein [Betaproteobacteria bacterium]